jgi:hypothetical protein
VVNADFVSARFMEHDAKVLKLGYDFDRASIVFKDRVRRELAAVEYYDFGLIDIHKHSPLSTVFA